MKTLKRNRVLAFLLAFLMLAPPAAAGLIPGSRAFAVSQDEIDKLKEEVCVRAAQ